MLNPDLSICYSLETSNYHPVVKLKCCVGCSVSGIIGEADYLVQSFCGMCDIIYADYHAGYVGSYGNPKGNFAPNPYNSGYSMNQVCLLASSSFYAGPALTSLNPHLKGLLYCRQMLLILPLSMDLAQHTLHGVPMTCKGHMGGDKYQFTCPFSKAYTHNFGREFHVNVVVDRAQLDKWHTDLPIAYLPIGMHKGIYTLFADEVDVVSDCMNRDIDSSANG